MDLAERIVVILISELEAYCFLCGQFAKEDVRRQRILLRERDYRKLGSGLIDQSQKATAAATQIAEK